MKFKGLTDWFEIFRTGTWTDAAGNTKTWSEQDLDTIAANYNPAEEEAPLVIGHPDTDSPAWGWVEGLKQAGGVLYAKGKQVVGEFEDMVKQGLFKRRSVRLTPDGTRLLHVGFLGAAAPAVKGLKNIAFDDRENGITIDYAIESWTLETVARIFRSIRDWIIEKEGKEKADAIIPDWDVEYIKDEAREAESGFAQEQLKKEASIMNEVKTKIKNMLMSMGIDMSKVPDEAIPESGSAKLFTEAEVAAQVEAAKEQATTEAKQAKDSEFAKREKTARAEARKAEIAAFCETLKKEGHMIPAWEKAGLQDFMQSLDGEEVIEFAAEAKASRLDWFKAFLGELPKVINFSEIATRDKDVSAAEPGIRLAAIAREKMSKDKELTYAEALKQACDEHSDLKGEWLPAGTE